MSDIVEQLRERARGGMAHDVLDEAAAAEIARLDLANRQSMAQADARSIENVALAAEVARLRRENELFQKVISAMTNGEPVTLTIPADRHAEQASQLASPISGNEQ